MSVKGRIFGTVVGAAGLAAAAGAVGIARQNRVIGNRLAGEQVEFGQLHSAPRVVVADDALLSAPFINLALAPEAASSFLLPQALGHQRAFEVFALGEPIDGRTALAWGLANRSVPADQVEVVAADLAAKLAARAPNSIRKTKGLMRDAERLWALMQREGEAFGSQMKSPEAMEAFMAFTQKRAPDFSKVG